MTAPKDPWTGDGDPIHGLLIAIGASILFFWVPLILLFAWVVSR